MPRKPRKQPPKRVCACPCRKIVCQRTEGRHLSGKGPKHITARLDRLTQQLGGPSRRRSKPLAENHHPTKSSSQPSLKQRVLGYSRPRPAISPELADPPQDADILDQMDDLRLPSPSIASVQEAVQDEGDTYGLSGPRRSRRVAEHVQSALNRWAQSSSEIPNREEPNDQEDARYQEGAGFLLWDAADDDEDNGDDNHDNDDDDDDDDGLPEFPGAMPGHEGIALWDLLGEGFLQEVSKLGKLFYSFIFMADYFCRKQNG